MTPETSRNVSLLFFFKKCQFVFTKFRKVSKETTMSALCEIDVSKIDFGFKDGKFARTTLDGALPKFKLGSVDAPCRAPFGISTPFSGDDAELRRTIDLEINPDDLAPLARIDEAVVAAGVENSEKWFGRELNEAAVRAMHTPIVIAAKKQEYAPTVRTKVNIATTQIYIHKGGKSVKKGSKEDVSKGSQVSAYVTLSSVMFGNRQFGVSLTVEKLLVKQSADASSSGASVFGDFVLEEDEPPAKRAKLDEENEGF